jgi:predicted nuclease of predicted toxin-antitoxin system
MKLLLDENISYRVLKIISSGFPDSIHVSDVSDLKQDSAIFLFAKENQYSIVTFDEDFFELQTMKGYPPKVVWLRFGNSNNLKVANKLLDNQQKIKDLILDPDKGTIEIY